MNIIDKKKEFYDYLVSVYGIDKDIVLDRRDSYQNNVYNKMHSNRDAVDRYFVIEVGTNQYLFHITYKQNENFTYGMSMYHPDNGFWVVDNIELVETYKSNTQIIEIQKDKFCGKWVNYYRKNKEDITTNSPTNYYSIGDRYIFRKNKSGKYVFTFDDIVRNSFRMNDDKYVSINEFSGHIPADEAYNAIYNFIIKKREPVIMDNMTDVQKLESKGFDKKTSFRKM